MGVSICFALPRCFSMPFIAKLNSNSCQSFTSATGTKFDKGQAPSQAFALSQGWPSFFNSVCKSLSVRSKAKPTPITASSAFAGCALLIGLPIKSAISVS